MMGPAHTFRVQPGEAPALARRPTALLGDEAVAKERLDRLRHELDELQRRLAAEAHQALVVVLQGMDGAGKDSTINHVFSHLHPQGVEVHAFKEPTPQESAHDWLWRYHAVVPPRGVIGLFNRSWYEGVLIERVDRLVAPATWRARFHHINHFEHLLVDSGTHVVKVMLHISKAEQKQRMLHRLADPHRYWKFNAGDIARRRQWPAYMRAYEDALTATSTHHAPWHVVPADSKPGRDVAVAQIVVDALRAMDPHFPPRPDLKRVRIP